MNNIVKILLGMLFVFIIILCIMKQPLNKCHHRKEGIENPGDNTDPDELENNIKQIKQILIDMQPKLASQSTLDRILTAVNDIKSNNDALNARFSR